MVDRAPDPTTPIKEAALSYPDVVQGVSCNQTTFKVGKKAFLYIGPGAKGVGFKAMFKLDKSLERARELAEKKPERYGVGSHGFVTIRFPAEKPPAKTEWTKWLRESYALAAGSKS